MIDGGRRRMREGVAEDDITGDEAIGEKGVVKGDVLSRELSHVSDGGDDFPSMASSGSVALIQRVDRLDRVLAEMEDKDAETGRSNYPSSSPGHGRSNSCPPTPSSLGKRCKPAESVLEEVEEKGTLVERVSQLEKRVSTLGESLRRVQSRRSSESGNFPEAILSFPPRETEAVQHVSSPDIPAVEEKREVSHLEYEHSQPADMPADYVKSDLGMRSETGDQQDLQKRGHEETEHKKSMQEMLRNEDDRPELVEKDAHLRGKLEKKGKDLRKWFSKSYKKVSSGLHDNSKGRSDQSGRHCWSGSLRPFGKIKRVHESPSTKPK